MISLHEYDTEDRLSHGSPSIPTSSIVKRIRLLFTTGHSNSNISTVYARPPSLQPPLTSPDHLNCSEPSSASYYSLCKQYRPSTPSQDCESPPFPFFFLSLSPFIPPSSFPFYPLTSLSLPLTLIYINACQQLLG